ncbi:MAG: hypothetical protein ACO0C9_05035 [Candidatus Methanosuratincola verstraetei]|jgi:hypothetical protein
MRTIALLHGQKDSEHYEVGHEREQRTKMKLLVVVLLTLAILSVYATNGWILKLGENERPFMLMGVPTIVDTETGSGIVVRIKSTCNETLLISSLTLRLKADSGGALTITTFSCKEIAPGELVQITAFSPVKLDGSSYEATITINGKDYPFVARRNA